jgi:hypothetical protein
VNAGTFFDGILMGKSAAMDVSRFLRFLFAVLIAIGLTAAPLAPVLAKTHTSDTGMQSMQMMDMSSDMPCCPDKDKQSGCDDCPFLAICVLKVLRDGPSATNLPVREASSRTLRPSDEPEITGLTRPPPDQPPRMIV